ncbi:MAG: hypothetical protein ACOC5K_02495, partial [Chloroflexota bacterium]
RTEDELLQLLGNSEIAELGLHPEGSNYVFVARMEAEVPGDVPLLAVYKPALGERPLRDFPRGTLHLRERAAYLVSRSLGWPSVPPTVVRDGPHGEGSLQLFVHAQLDRHYFNMRDESLDPFEAVAVFDLLVNNADRKGSACLLDEHGNLWAIDHGLTFNPYARIRTVMFEFCGRPISENLLRDLRRLQTRLESHAELCEELGSLIGPHEVVALIERLERILEDPVFPVLDEYRNIPWPLL